MGIEVKDDNGFTDISVTDEHGNTVRKEHVDIFDLYNRVLTHTAGMTDWSEIGAARVALLDELGYGKLSTRAASELTLKVIEAVDGVKKKDPSNNSADTPSSTASPSGLTPVENTPPA